MHKRQLARCVYCGYPGAKMRGGQWTCYSCRDLPAFERNADAEVELMIGAWYEGKWSKSVEGSIRQRAELDRRDAPRQGIIANAVHGPSNGIAIG
jgi:hypothetical protein